MNYAVGILFIFLGGIFIFAWPKLPPWPKPEAWSAKGNPVRNSDGTFTITVIVENPLNGGAGSLLYENDKNTEHYK